MQLLPGYSGKCEHVPLQSFPLLKGNLLMILVNFTKEQGLREGDRRRDIREKKQENNVCQEDKPELSSAAQRIWCLRLSAMI